MATRRLTDRTLDLDTLEVLERIAEAGSLSRAADTLGVTQQAVSARLAVAERALGQPLVSRSATGSTMTETGRLLLSLAGPVLDASRRLEAALVALQRPVGTLVVAASQTIAELLLPGWLLRFPEREPDVTVRLIAGNSAAVTDLVRSGTAHVGFVETPMDLVGLSWSVVAEDELVVVVAPDHAWSRVTDISADELAATPLLLREAGSGTRATLEEWLRRTGATLATPAAVLETTGIVRANACAGIAPAVMSICTVHADLASGALVRVALDGPPLHRPLRAIWTGDLQGHAATLVDVARTGPHPPAGAVDGAARR
ncbi:LysR family transcriptional regulator [Curtobacterium sp. 9128]|uniref:LysR family transcriptional regulator n=1 Tax=Curtobacterium sp. 9128 TaxID=1793722 RepID=UPI0011AAE758|nr:LysR family transcriptional regulator [Curtobacterium sp. 9128]